MRCATFLRKCDVILTTYLKIRASLLEQISRQQTFPRNKIVVSAKVTPVHRFGNVRKHIIKSYLYIHL